MPTHARPHLPAWRQHAQPIAPAGHEFLVRPDIAFLNHGSFGARARPVVDALHRWQAELEAEPVQFLGNRLSGLLAQARARLADYVGTYDDNLVFVPNTTHGMNIVARSLKLHPGDEVLGTSHEYGAVERAWTFVCEAQGARYVEQDISLPVTTAEAVIEQVWQGVTERTRVLVVSHITSPTALIFPVAAICQKARQQGILTVVDGAHAPGQIDLALDALGADFYLGNCHKWLCGPVGAGFLYARPERQPLLEPLIVSWGWRAEVPGPSRFEDYFGWIGTDDPAAALCVPSAIAFQQQHDWASVRTLSHRLAADARARICTLTGLPPICPDTPEWWGQMCSMLLPKTEGIERQTLQAWLWDEFQVEAPIIDWHGYRFVRVSIQAYNAPEDVDRLLEGLSVVLARSPSTP